MSAVHHAAETRAPLPPCAAAHAAGALRLVLPYPLSANRYWRPVPIGGHVTIVPTKEAKAYRKEVAALCAAAGVTKPMAGRLWIEVRLYPSRPQDWQARQRKLGAEWDLGVRCIDLDNANKVLLDSLTGVAIEDDGMVFRLSGERMEPDAHGARVVVQVGRIDVPVRQLSLIGEGA
jgi:crossover junction endodeoxyribonuclease RusA